MKKTTQIFKNLFELSAPQTQRRFVGRTNHAEWLGFYLWKKKGCFMRIVLKDSCQENCEAGFVIDQLALSLVIWNYFLIERRVTFYDQESQLLYSSSHHRQKERMKENERDGNNATLLYVSLVSHQIVMNSFFSLQLKTRSSQRNPPHSVSIFLWCSVKLRRWRIMEFLCQNDDLGQYRTDWLSVDSEIYE